MFRMLENGGELKFLCAWENIYWDLALPGGK